MRKIKNTITFIAFFSFLLASYNLSFSSTSELESKIKYLEETIIEESKKLQFLEDAFLKLREEKKKLTSQLEQKEKEIFNLKEKLKELDTLKEELEEVKKAKEKLSQDMKEKEKTISNYTSQ
ncbi:MAG: hypothetical protein J7K71_03355, partial [Candidatus Omnitrophica bacterium]|nr:hypothetical protein [Candidatus Omnitrophota bacterium]